MLGVGVMSLVLLLAIGVTGWYFLRNPGQSNATDDQTLPAAASSPPSVSSAPSGSPSQTSAVCEPNRLEHPRPPGR